ncbi:DUF4352 domain-containing protein [Streptomyces marokkonensis]|uniref:DUF4352 domain-containing protein n=1 Tax=Streptomyces marokkonensis TaxID=324855 RepID=A0ABW6QIP9_9ACTN
MRTAPLALAALILAASVAGCRSDSEYDTRVTVVSSGDNIFSDSLDPLEMGIKYAINDNENDVHLTVQALEYQQPYKGRQSDKLYNVGGVRVWATVSIRLCNLRGSTFSVDQSVWSLAYVDGIITEPTGLTGPDIPQPEYPINAPLEAGRCASGLISYSVRSDKRPERLLYGPQGFQPIEWVIPEG